jgi:hypothetical protein
VGAGADVKRNMHIELQNIHFSGKCSIPEGFV